MANNEMQVKMRRENGSTLLVRVTAALEQVPLVTPAVDRLLKRNVSHDIRG
jgi:hypothetical protein